MRTLRGFVFGRPLHATPPLQPWRENGDELHIFFIDESGTPAKLGKPEPQYFVLAGVTVPSTSWHTLHNKLAGLKVATGFKGEVKWRFFAPNNNDDDNPMRNWPQDERDAFRQSFFKIVTDQRSVQIIGCVCHCSSAYRLASINTQDDLYFRTYKPLTERFQYFLQDRSKTNGQKETGIIVADHRGSKQDNRLRIQHERLVSDDARFTSNYKNFVEGLFFAPSHMSVGIQYADMVAGAIWRKYERNDDKFYKAIEPSIRRSETGKIEGFGIIKFPTKKAD